MASKMIDLGINDTSKDLSNREMLRNGKRPYLIDDLSSYRCSLTTRCVIQSALV